MFDNTGKESEARFAALSRIFDPGTIRHLEARGVEQGWRCLEIGAGGGSIAVWLAEPVGRDGHVLATDIDTRFLQGLHLANLEVREPNVSTDPLPEKAFDLVHARLVLCHLPAREQALRRLTAALKPGGWILIEDVDLYSVWPDPSRYPVEVLLRTYDAYCRVLCFGRRLVAGLRAIGLRDVDAEGRVFLWQGRSTGAALLRANLEQLHDPHGRCRPDYGTRI